MKLSIVIPTYRRERKLHLCMQAVGIAREFALMTCPTRENMGLLREYQSDLMGRWWKDMERNKYPTRALEDIHCIIWAGDQEECDRYTEKYMGMDWVLVMNCNNNDDRVPDAWNTELMNTPADMVHFLCDDQWVFPDCYNKAFAAFNSRFPDYNGVLGVTTANEDIRNPGLAYSVTSMIIGVNFCKSNFSNGKPFCPEYRRFSFDTEFAMFADSLGKLHIDPEIRMVHLSPHLRKSWFPHDTMMCEDATHKESRDKFGDDGEILRQRLRKGYLWGRDFNTVRVR